MGKVILLFGALASLGCAISLGALMERRELAALDAAKGLTATGNELEDYRFLVRCLPGAEIRIDSRDELIRLRGCLLDLPALGIHLSTLQWEVRREGKTLRWTDPPAFQFWGLPGVIAAAPLVLAALAAGAITLASGKERKP